MKTSESMGKSGNKHRACDERIGKKCLTGNSEYAIKKKVVATNYGARSVSKKIYRFLKTRS